MSKTYRIDGYTLSITQSNSSQVYVGNILENNIVFYCDTVGEVLREFYDIIKELNTSNGQYPCQNYAY